MTGRVEGKVAIVTGGGGDIGGSTARLLATHGARIVVADIAEAPGIRVVESIRASGGDAVFAHLDVRDPSSFADLAAHALDVFGRIDILHNNAAATGLYARDHGVLDMDVSVWDEIMAVNLRSVMLGCKSVIPAMIGQGSGSIINMSSTRAVAGALDLVGYGTSKAGVEGLTRYVATAHGAQGIRCNAVRPGAIDSSKTAGLHASTGVGRFLPHLLTPFVGSVEDIAMAVLFLASDESRYINGQVLAVDGGLLAHQPFLAESRQSGA